MTCIGNSKKKAYDRAAYVYRNPWSPRELSTNIKEMGEEVTFDQAVTPPEDLRLNYRGLAIVNHLRENNASRSRYLEQWRLVSEIADATVIHQKQ